MSKEVRNFFKELDPSSVVSTENAYVKNQLVKLFFLSKPETFMEIYQDINKTNEFTPKAWNKYVNSKPLHDLVYNKVITLSRQTRQMVAYSETADSYGIEIHTDKQEIYIALPLSSHQLSPFAKSIMDMRKKQMSSDEYSLEEVILNQVATRAFITTLNHMFFGDSFNKSFHVFKREGVFVLNDRLDYQKKTQLPGKITLSRT